MSEKFVQVCGRCKLQPAYKTYNSGGHRISLCIDCYDEVHGVTRKAHLAKENKFQRDRYRTDPEFRRRAIERATKSQRKAAS